ncbi:ABC transporter substrate-binding protein [Bacillus taeanensis]|uniref:BMP family ABC transporter substrate-binding protein n=1 Tax=Bacillus taeanensis TaxID=273032 RepID=A0A366XRQ8_9BACI|nr:ABC transporter substrate-binding protein [Bacillus taeanensis]RBW69050.1 BMP family ABC transporter substrate-binding protein [Bacillus taeanensis]
MALAGCGTSDKEAADNTEGGASAEPVSIGITQIVEHPSLDAATEGFKAALKENGFENAKFDVQIAQGDMNTSMTIAQNFVGDKVDLIFANSTPSAQSALNATNEIPIVFTAVTDPVGAQLVPSMEEAGVNITGTSDTLPAAIPSTVKFIAENFDVTKVGLIYNAGEQNAEYQVEQVKEEMEGTGLEAVEAPVSTSAEVKQAAESLVGRADVIYVVKDNTVVSALESVVAVANDSDLPLFVGEGDSVKRGGFAGFGVDYYELGYQTGEMAVQILKSEKAISEVAPVYAAQELKLLINKNAAKEMDIELKPEWDDIAEYIE